MKYDLFLSDFDGTLVAGDGRISQIDFDAIQEYLRRGGKFVVVTGRMLSSILPRMKEIGLSEGLVVACQGAVIADIATGKLIKHDCFSTQSAAIAVRELEESGFHVHIYDGDKLFANRNDSYLKWYEQVCGVKGVVPGEMLYQKILKEGMQPDKILAMLSPKERDPLRERLAKELGSGYKITSSSDWMVELTPPAVSKAAAAAFLCEFYQIPKEKTAAIGDQLNDLPMIEFSGGKFAVENAANELKINTEVVSSVLNGGVAEALYIAMEFHSARGAEKNI